MKGLMEVGGEKTMTSLDLRGMVNVWRKEAGGNPILNTDFLVKVRDELDLEESTYGSSTSYKMNSRGTKSAYYDLTMAQAVQVLTRESPSARRMLSESITDHMEVLKAYQHMDVTELEPDRYVYVIKNINTGAYKVGISKDPEQRLKSLQVGNDGELKLIGCKQGTFQDETDAHRKLADKNIRSEWFRLDEKDVQTLIN